LELVHFVGFTYHDIKFEFFSFKISRKNIRDFFSQETHW
jgi:hypothetical protein